MTEDPCDDCGEPVSDALSRTVQLAVDRTQIDAHRLCPDCFADWIDRYQREMGTDDGSSVDIDDDDIIVD